ncbi:retinoblastoma-like protein 1 [Rhodnius prolixus]|uniref:RB_A domain-containing protein n=1 Tax=Rhodnius prolixus TaxID=13249 RepID=T1HVA1_RHOPR
MPTSAASPSAETNSTANAANIMPPPPPFLDTSAQTIATLHSMLHSQEPAPSEYFIGIIKLCKAPPKIEKLVLELTNQIRDFLRTNTNEEISEQALEATGDMILKMFYKLIDCILPEETEKPAFDSNILLNQDVFIKSLFACAVEIVFFSSLDERLKFPKVIQVLDIPPYYFYRIIEVVVRKGDLLSREIVKHLNTIEESILESMAWKCDSPLWRAVIESGLPIPSFDDVNPGSVDRQKASRANKVSKLPSINKDSVPTSPGAPLADKFLSPCVKRGYSQIESFTIADSGEPPLKILLSRLNAASENGENREVKLIKIQTNDTKSSADSPDVHKENKKPRRSGSLALFFRKFYQLASVRLKDLCDWLKITYWDLIWTCFETTIINHVGLMFERHLDQLLLCAIYVVCKIVGLQPSFVDILRCYRYLPQAASSVYRKVLVAPDRCLDDLKNADDLKELVRAESEIRGDIAKFYNEVYVKKVQTFAKRFRGGENERVVLSPLPVGKTASSNITSRVSGTGLPILLRSLDHNSQSPTNSPMQHSYIFSRSPAKDLQNINRMVSSKELARISKQLLNDDDKPETSSVVVSRKMKDLYADRMTVNNQN